MNSLSREQQLAALHLIVEGNSLRSITRLTGIHRTTVIKLMLRAGQLCRAMLSRWMRNLTLSHVEIDEIWTFVLKKQGRVPVSVDDSEIGDQYVFIGIDEATKVIPCFALGKRTKETTDHFIGDLAARLVLPDLFDAGPRPKLSTDGWRAYPDSIEMAFAGRASHGVLVKDYRNADMPGRYGPPEMVGASRSVVNGDIDESEICTSHVERHNLSVRTFLKRFTRLSLGFSKKLLNLEAAFSLYVAHYNFCRWHNSLKKTPAMAAKITGHPWTLEELLTEAENGGE
jgi:IS1 family transposase